MVTKKRWLWMLAAVIALYAVGNYGLRHFVILPSFFALERDEAKKDIARCVDAIRRETYHLGQLTTDWAAWDDTYRFVQDGNAEYIESNMEWESLEDSGLNLIYICDQQGRVVWGESYDSSQGGRIRMEEFPEDSLGKDHYLLEHDSLDSAIDGVCLTGRGPLLVSSRPILTSRVEGPIRGTLIMGRFLNEETFQALKKQTYVDFSVKNLRNGKLNERERSILARLKYELYVIEECGDDLLRACGMLVDLEGNPALLITAEVPRDIMSQGKAAARFASVSVLLTAVSIIVIGSIIVMMIVNLMRDKEGPSSGRLLSPRDLLVVAVVAGAGLMLTIGAFSMVRSWEQEKLVLALGFFLTAWLATYVIGSRRRTARVRALVEERTAELREQQSTLRCLLDSIPDIVFCKDINGVYLSCNPPFAEFVGRDIKDIIGYTDYDLFKEDLADFFRENDRKMMEQTKRRRNEEWITYPDDRRVLLDTLRTPFHGPDGKTVGILGISRDITKRKEAEEALRESRKRYRELSIRDSLTKLYNSRCFFSQLKAETRRATRYSRPLSLLLLDIDNFKHYNDRYGHLEGDEVLAKIGKVLLESLRQTDSAYRYGGEEFTVILPETGGKEATNVAEKIRERLETETFCPTSDKAVHVTASIGVAQYISEEEFSAFIKRADNAMYVSKEKGKNRVFFSR